jgi:hypothetical protein
VGRELRLRGLNARVLTGGTVRVGDVVRKLPISPDSALAMDMAQALT